MNFVETPDVSDLKFSLKNRCGGKRFGETSIFVSLFMVLKLNGVIARLPPVALTSVIIRCNNLLRKLVDVVINILLQARR